MNTEVLFVDLCVNYDINYQKQNFIYIILPALTLKSAIYTKFAKVQVEKLI